MMHAAVGRRGRGTRWIAWLLLGLVLTIGCASGPEKRSKIAGAPPEMETWGAIDRADLEFPDHLGSVVLVDSTDFSEDELGVSFKYADSTHRDAAIDVYVYPITKPPGLCLRRVLEAEAGRIVLEMDEVVRRAGGKTEPPRYFQAGLSGAAAPVGIGWIRDFSVDGVERVSFAFVTVRQHRVWKLRVTVPRATYAADDGSYFQELVDLLHPAIRLREGVVEPQLVVNLMGDVLRLPQHEQCNIAGWTLGGWAMLEQIRRGHYLDTFDRELAVRTHILQGWQRMLANGESCHSDVLEAMSQAQEAGLLEEYVFWFYGGGRWPKREDLDLAAFESWARANLKEHDPVVDPGFVISWKTPTDEAASAKD